MKYNGEGIQHIACSPTTSRDRRQAARAGVPLHDTPERRYYEMLDERVPDHGEDVAALQTRGILIDGTTEDGKQRKLLQIFSADAARPDLLRVHPAQGRRRLRRRQLQGAVRVDRARPDAARRAARRHERRQAHGYQSGFGNEFATEALPARCRSAATRRSARRTASTPSRCAAPRSPRRAPRTARSGSTASARRRCTAVRAHRRRPHRQRRSTTSRRRPTSCAGIRCRCRPSRPISSTASFTMAGNGGPAAQTGVGSHLYAANRSMQERCFYDADGELLIVPQQGRLRIATELGMLDVEPQEIVVIPRGVRFRVELPDGAGARLRLRELRRQLPPARPRPDRLERPRQSARLPDAGRAPTRTSKARSSWSPSSRATCGRRAIDHSPLDVVAWHGNYAPYKYDLRRFNTIGSISYDHPDPSIFLVLHLAPDTPASSNIDFVVFPPRWLVDAGHVPAAVVPPQRRQRVHGPRARRVRRQGRRLRARRREPAQLHDRPRPRRARRSRRRAAPTRRKPDVITRHDGLHVRDARRSGRRARRSKSAELQDDYFRCWQGLQKHFDPSRR